jgi:hypothetical protein
VELFHHNLFAGNMSDDSSCVGSKCLVDHYSSLLHATSSFFLFLLFLMCINMIYEPDLHLIVIDGCSCSKTVAK